MLDYGDAKSIFIEKTRAFVAKNKKLIGDKYFRFDIISERSDDMWMFKFIVLSESFFPYSETTLYPHKVWISACIFDDKAVEISIVEELDDILADGF